MTTTDNARALTLVLGGTGKTGRRVVQRLTARGEPAGGNPHPAGMI
jgi:hypothetical protein